MDANAIEDRLQWAVKIAREAGHFTLGHYRRADLEVISKGDGSPVTAADRGAEQLLRERIAERFPDDAILGEEFGQQPGSSGFKWVLDPIDGTKSFVSGVPLYTTLVAVMRDSEPVLGVIYAPAAGEIVYATLEGQCWHAIGSDKPRVCRVSDVSDLSQAVYLTTCVRSYTVDRARDGRPAFDRLAAACRVSRTWGDAYGYLLVATGRAEIMIDPVMNLWDAAALKPIIEAAGGVFCDWQGRPSVHSGESVATNRHLSAAVLGLLADPS